MGRMALVRSIGALVLVVRIVASPLPGGPPPSVWAAAASSGLIPWHPHLTAHLAAGLSVEADLADGHVDLVAADLSLPARGPALALAHTWDSTQALAGHTTWAGQGWYATLGASMSGAPGSTVTYTDGSGAQWTFAYAGGAYQTPPGLPVTLTAGGSGYTLTNFLTGTVLAFDSSGRYVSNTDAYGNANSLTYGSSGPTGDANSGGRSLTLLYSANLLSEVKSPLWVSSGGAQGQHLTYGYTGQQLTGLVWGAGTGDATSISFSYTGNLLTGVTTGGGHAWVLGYTTGQLTAITSPSAGVQGQPGYTPSYTTQITYAVGQTTVVRGYGTSAAVTTTVTIDGQGQPLSVKDGLNDTASATYDSDHDVLTATDANNHTTTYHYQYVGPNGSVGLATEVDYPAINNLYPSHAATAPVLTSKYDPATYDLLEADSSQGSSIRYTYDGHHQVKTKAVLLSSTGGTYTWRGESYTYNANGELTDAVDGRGVSVPNTTSFTTNPTVTVANGNYTTHRDYFPQGDLQDIKSPPMGNPRSPTILTTSYAYDGDGDRTGRTSPGSHTTTYAFDHLGRPTTSTLPQVTLYTGTNANSVSSVAYDGDGNVIKRIDGNNDTVQYSFDPLGRVFSVTNPLNETTQYTYTATHTATMQDPMGNVTTYSYDAADRPNKVVDAAGQTTGYQYDPVGNVTTITRGDGTTALTTVTDTYDALNELGTKAVSGPNTATQTTTYSYDLNGDLVRDARPNGTVQFHSYDLADQQTALELDAGSPNTPAGTNQQTFSYDAAGNRTTSGDADGRTTTISYDAVDRITQTQTGSPTTTVTYGYDSDSNLTSRSETTYSPAGTCCEGFTYSASFNAAGWRTSSTDAGQTGSLPYSLTTNYGYDAAARLRTQSYQGGTESITLNAGGEATGIGDGTASASFGYNPDDLPSTDTLGLSETLTYDKAQRLTGFLTPSWDSYSLAYNAAGMTTAITSTVNQGPQSVQTFTHDALSHLIGQGGGSNGSWSYDGTDNYKTISLNGGTTTYTYNTSSPNEVALLGGVFQSRYTYDNRGDVTNAGGITGQNLAYDQHARLVKVSSAQSGATVATMNYNALGQRAYYTYTPSGQQQPSLTIQFQYRGSRVGQAIVTSGGTTYTDTYLYRQTGAPMELLRTQGGVTSRYWYVLNPRGDVIALQSVSSGQIVDQYTYDAVGNLTGISEQVPQRLRYRGYWYDQELGWYWLSVREYDPKLERFLQPDPSYVGGQYQYAYANDNQIDNSDPSGLMAAGGPKNCGPDNVNCGGGDPLPCSDPSADPNNCTASADSNQGLSSQDECWVWGTCPPQFYQLATAASAAGNTNIQESDIVTVVNAMNGAWVGPSNLVNALANLFDPPNQSLPSVVYRGLTTGDTYNQGDWYVTGKDNKGFSVDSDPVYLANLRNAKGEPQYRGLGSLQPGQIEAGGELYLEPDPLPGDPGHMLIRPRDLGISNSAMSNLLKALGKDAALYWNAEAFRGPTEEGGRGGDSISGEGGGGGGGGCIDPEQCRKLDAAGSPIPE